MLLQLRITQLPPSHTIGQRRASSTSLAADAPGSCRLGGARQVGWEGPPCLSCARGRAAAAPDVEGEALNVNDTDSDLRRGTAGASVSVSYHKGRTFDWCHCSDLYFRNFFLPF